MRPLAGLSPSRWGIDAIEGIQAIGDIIRQPREPRLRRDCRYPTVAYASAFEGFDKHGRRVAQPRQFDRSTLKRWAVHRDHAQGNYSRRGQPAREPARPVLQAHVPTDCHNVFPASRARRRSRSCRHADRRMHWRCHRGAAAGRYPVHAPPDRQPRETASKSNRAPGVNSCADETRRVEHGNRVAGPGKVARPRTGQDAFVENNLPARLLRQSCVPPNAGMRPFRRSRAPVRHGPTSPRWRYRATARLRANETTCPIPRPRRGQKRGGVVFFEHRHHARWAGGKYSRLQYQCAALPALEEDQLRVSAGDLLQTVTIRCRPVVLQSTTARSVRLEASVTRNVRGNHHEHHASHPERTPPPPFRRMRMLKRGRPSTLTSINCASMFRYIASPGRGGPVPVSRRVNRSRRCT